MAYQLTAWKIEGDGSVRVKHTFYGETEAEAQEHFDEHVSICPKFGPAERDGDVESVMEEIDELPTRESVMEEIGEEEIEDDE